MNNIINLSLSKKLASGFIFIIVVAVSSSLAIFFNLQRLKNIDAEITDYNSRLLGALKDYSFLMSESVKLTNSWIYQPNRQDKERLHKILDTDINEQAETIKKISAYAQDDSSKFLLEDVFAQASLVLYHQKNITSVLANEESYSDDQAVDKAIDEFDNQLSKAYESFQQKYAQINTQLAARLEQLNATKANSYSFMTGSMLVITITVIVIGILATLLSNKSISKPINDLQKVISASSRGELADVAPVERQDEVGKINNAIVDLIENLKSKTQFAMAIGKGDYDKQLVLKSESDVLGKALIEMRDSLKKAQAEDKKRDWFNTGIAQLSEVLRKYQNDHENLYDQVMTFVIKYLNANQGAFFELIEENGMQLLQMKACYAYDRKKYLDSTIELGEGLVGQAAVEKDYIYITDVPEDYANITSGIGGSTPKAVLIFPLIVNEKVYGVVEIASFQELEKHEIDFALKIGESIASTVSSVKVNAITKVLLAEARQKEEELRAQEEEMRQNMEELHATQEQMRRSEQDTAEKLKMDFSKKEREYLQKIAELEAKIAQLA